MKIKMIKTHGVKDYSSMRKVYVDGRYQSHTVAFNTEWEWSDFVEYYKDTNNWDHYPQKLKIPMLIPGELHIDGGQKTKENIKSRSGLIFDFDQVDVSIDLISERFKEYEFFMYSSPSNGIKSGLNCRMILPFAGDVSSEDWELRVAALKQAFSNKDDVLPFDTSAFTISQGQNIPAKIDGTETFAIYNSGRYFDIYEYEVKKDVFIDVITPTSFDFDNPHVQRVIATLIDNNRNSLDRSQCWNVGKVLVNLGIYDLSIIDALRLQDSNTSSTNAFEGQPKPHHTINFLRKYMPDGFEWPNFEELALADIVAKKTKVTHDISTVEVDESQYDHVFHLEPDQFLDDIRDELLNSFGKVTILDAVCGAGKSYMVSHLASQGKAVFASPLNIILKQNVESDNPEIYNSIESGTMTWQKVKNMVNSEDCSELILFIDEAHGLYLDSFKAEDVEVLMKCFKEFGKVVLMSGTIRKEYFSNLKVDTVIRVDRPAKFKKVYNRVVISNKLNEVKELCDAVLQDFKDDGKPFIIYNNNIKKNIYMEEMLYDKGIKVLHVNAENDFVNHPDYVRFMSGKSSSLLSDIGCQGIICTNSGVEGMNVKDITDIANVYVIGECSPERIEQITNRFRKCTGVINVYHYIHQPSMEKDNFDFQKAINLAIAKADIENEEFKMYNDDIISMKLNTWNYSKSIMWNYEHKEWQVNYLNLDNTYADIRTSRATNDIRICAGMLKSYGFEMAGTRNMKVEDTDINVKLQTIEEVRENRRKERLIELKEKLGSSEEVDSFVKKNMKDNSTETITAKSIQNLLSAGMPEHKISDYMDRIIANEDGWKDVYKDMKDAKYGNEITRFIIARIKKNSEMKNGKRTITTEYAKQLATDIILLCFEKVHKGTMPVDECVSIFGNKFEIVNGEITISGKQQNAREILNQFICLSVANKNTKRYTIEHWNRTGFMFTNSDNNVMNAQDQTLMNTQDSQALAVLMGVNRQYQSVVASVRAAYTKQRRAKQKEQKIQALALFGMA